MNDSAKSLFIAVIVVAIAASAGVALANLFTAGGQEKDPTTAVERVVAGAGAEAQEPAR
ncbi:hypothetical protein [Pelomonas sp. KK5]|uniref:hypothetical protein n=1 Tax=Pelomonas sp. KK5 TaxID=1855730 RepID=UPI001301F5B4|nr:hypothetical protein [Pelomonas sp. KK5]